MHRVHDDGGSVAFDVPDFEDGPGLARPDDHREAIPKIPGLKLIPVRMEDVFTLDSMLESREGENRSLGHSNKLTWRILDSLVLVQICGRLVGCGSAARETLSGRPSRGP